jgi:hypothetical protein
MPTDELLNERGKTHGDWPIQSSCSYSLKQEARNGLARAGTDLTASQSEGLSMILHKCARIVCGDPNEPDHWDDIAGYATLVANEIRKARAPRVPRE